MQTMAETATETITIAAAPDQVWAIATDLERYPEWAHDVKDVVITSRDPDGRPSHVEFRTSALGRSTHYTLQYDYSHAPEHARVDDGEGRHPALDRGRLPLRAHPDGGTVVHYDLAIELVVPLPGFVKRRAERRILNAIKEMKAFAEGSGMTANT